MRVSTGVGLRQSLSHSARDPSPANAGFRMTSLKSLGCEARVQDEAFFFGSDQVSDAARSPSEIKKGQRNRLPS